MANSRYDYLKEREKATDLRFNDDSYIIVRIDGDKFHKFSTEHDFHKPNDKRALDLMVDSAKQVMRTYKGHIPLAYGHSDEFSFLIKNTSNILSRRVFKITSMLTSVFTAHYNTNWDTFFDNLSNSNAVPRKYDAWFDARPKEYANFRTVIDYFRWRQIDCHINNLYNTTLHALTGRYIKHELVPVDSIGDIKEKTYTSGTDDGKLYTLKRTPISKWGNAKISSQDATKRLAGTRSSDKHEILFTACKINYNDELEQFKKGTVVVDVQKDYDQQNNDEMESLRSYNVDLLASKTFWDNNRHIFNDYVECPPLK